jgi:hypothetical protein
MPVLMLYAENDVALGKQLLKVGNPTWVQTPHTPFVRYCFCFFFFCFCCFVQRPMLVLMLYADNDMALGKQLLKVGTQPESNPSQPLFSVFLSAFVLCVIFFIVVVVVVIIVMIVIIVFIS